MGGTTGADTICQTRANTNAGLSASTWKAILSGDAASESDWAINRIGYAGSELWTINPDGSTRARAILGQNLWTAPMLLDNKIEYTESGTLITATQDVYTNTTISGSGYNAACNGWTTNSSSGQAPFVGTTSSSTSTWINLQARSCDWIIRLYCVEQ